MTIQDCAKIIASWFKRQRPASVEEMIAGANEKELLAAIVGLPPEDDPETKEWLQSHIKSETKLLRKQRKERKKRLKQYAK